MYIKGEFVGGCDIVLSSGYPIRFAQPRIQLIASAVHQSGELEKLLVKEGLVPELPPLPEGEK